MTHELSQVPATTALVVIDMQRDFCEAGGYAAQAGLDVQRLAAPIAVIGRLLEAARRAGVMVVHTREGHVADLSDCPAEKMRRSVAAGAPIGSPGPLGRLLVRGEFGHDFIDALRPASGETVIDKPGYSAFHATALGNTLQARRIDTLVFCGVTTEVCVHSSLRSAVDLGFRCFTVADACAGSTLALHDAALAMVAVEGGIFGSVVDSAAVVAAWSPADSTGLASDH